MVPIAGNQPAVVQQAKHTSLRFVDNDWLGLRRVAQERDDAIPAGVTHPRHTRIAINDKGKLVVHNPQHAEGV